LFTCEKLIITTPLETFAGKRYELFSKAKKLIPNSGHAAARSRNEVLLLLPDGEMKITEGCAISLAIRMREETSFSP
jgi:hypothetical protein